MPKTSLHKVKSHVKKHISKIAIGFLVLLVLGSIGVGYFAYSQLEHRFEATNSQNQKYEAQLQSSLDAAQKQAQDASDSVQKTQTSLDEQVKKSEALAKNLATTQEASQQQIDQLQQQLSQVSAS